MSMKSLIQQGVFVTAAFFALAILAVHPAEAEAQTGTVLAGPFAPTGPTGNGRGIAFDGIDLYYTITEDPNIYQIDTTGILLNTVAVPAGDPRVSSGGPLAWDGLYLWTVDYSNALVMYRINPATGVTVSSCNIAAINPGHPALAGLDFPDGLHWTGSQLVLSGEITAVGRPAAVVYMNPDCTITSFFTAPAAQPGAWSGVAVDGCGGLWQADPFALIIEETDQAGVKSGVFFPSAGLGLEDLEFDASTFAGNCAVWGNEATIGPNRIAAFEVPCPDADGDGVLDCFDVCPGTVIPEGVPTVALGVNRWALVDGDGIFDTLLPPGGGGGPGLSFSVGDTGGCSCEQIITALDLGMGHTKFGCSISAMETWLFLVNP
jgi:hypothetical protein